VFLDGLNQITGSLRCLHPEQVCDGCGGGLLGERGVGYTHHKHIVSFRCDGNVCSHSDIEENCAKLCVVSEQ